MSSSVLSRTGLMLIAAMCMGGAIAAFTEGGMRPAEAAAWLCYGTLPCFVAGMSTFSYRLFRLKNSAMNLAEMRTMFRVSCVLYLPLLAATALVILATFAAPFAFAFGWVDPKAHLQLEANQRLLFMWLFMSWFFAGFLGWTDFMSLPTDIQMREWELKRVPINRVSPNGV